MVCHQTPQGLKRQLRILQLTNCKVLKILLHRAFISSDEAQKVPHVAQVAIKAQEIVAIEDHELIWWLLRPGAKDIGMIDGEEGASERILQAVNTPGRCIQLLDREVALNSSQVVF